MCQQSRIHLILCSEQGSGGGTIRDIGNRLLEPLPDRRQGCDEFCAGRDQGGNPLPIGAYNNLGYNGTLPTVRNVFSNPVLASAQGNMITSIQTALGGNAAAVLASGL